MYFTYTLPPGLHRQGQKMCRLVFGVVLAAAHQPMAPEKPPNTSQYLVLLEERKKDVACPTPWMTGRFGGVVGSIEDFSPGIGVTRLS
jgi:hypothetical protein